MRNSQGNTRCARVSPSVFHQLLQDLLSSFVRESSADAAVRHSAPTQRSQLQQLSFRPAWACGGRRAALLPAFPAEARGSRHTWLTRFHTARLSHAEFRVSEPPLKSNSFLPAWGCNPFWHTLYIKPRVFIRRQLGQDQCILDLGTSQISKTVETKFKGG